MEFERLNALPGFIHRFTLRHPDIDVDGDRDEVLQRLLPWHLAEVAEMGFPASALHLTEQVHGAGVVVVQDPISTGRPLQGADGMVSKLPGLVLGIYVADCCAVFLADPVSGAFGLVHSGKKGSELGITSVAIEEMRRLGARTEDIRVQLSPCIRPPAYEIDFAAKIRQDCVDAGVLPAHLWDDGTCTAREVERFYSYRTEKGRTGRMLALLGRA